VWLVALLALATERLDAHGEPVSLPPAALVERAVAKELRAVSSGHYMYQVRRQTPKGSRTYAVVETGHWLIGKLIRIDGGSLSPEEERKEDERLLRTTRDPGRLRKTARQLREEAHLVRDALEAFPRAFRYEPAGVETGASGDRQIRLAFTPSPGFRAPSRQLKVLEGLAGTLVVDANAERIVRITASLTRSVKFGWGVLGRLEEGGTILVEQRELDSRRWELATLEVHLAGKVLFVKQIRIDTVMRTSQFRRMRDDLTLEEGLEVLAKEGKEEDEMSEP